MIPAILALLGLWMFRVRTVCGGLYPDDSGETIAAAWNLDIAHPPGDPLYALLGRFWLDWGPAGSLAFRGNLLSGALSLACAWVLVRLTLRVSGYAAGEGRRHRSADLWSFLRSENWDLRPAMVSAFLAAGLVVLAPYFSLQASGAKGGVYVLNALLGAGAFLALTFPGSRGLSASAFLLGAGLAHHWPSFAALSPGWVLAAFFRDREFWPRRWVLSLASLLAGLSLYLYLPLRAALNLPLNWGKPTSAVRFWDNVSRSVYTQAEGPGKGWEAIRGDALVCLGHLASEWLWAGLLAAAWGTWLLLRPGEAAIERWKQGAKRRALIQWLHENALPLGVLGSILSLTASVVLFPNPGEGIEFILMNYMILPAALVAVLVGRGFQDLLVRTLDLVRGERVRRWGLAGVLAVVLLIQGARGLLKSDLSGDVLALNYGRNILDTLAPGAVLFGEGDHNVIPLYYLLYAENLRPDVVLVTTVFQNFAWGLEILQGRHPDLGLEETGESLSGRLSQILAKKGERPAFYSTLKGTLEETKLPVRDQLVPEGLLLRLAEAPAGKGDRGTGSYAAWGRYRLGGIFDQEDDKDPNRVTVRRYYAGSLVNLGNDLQERGQPAVSLDPYQAALRAFSACAPCYSNMAAAQGRMASDLRDRARQLIKKKRNHEASGLLSQMQAYFNQARVLLEKAERADPAYGGTYANLGNVRLFEGDLVGALEAYQRALKEDPQAPAAQKNMQILLTQERPRLASQYRLRGDVEAKRAEEAKNVGHSSEAERLRRQAAELYEKALSYGGQDSMILSNLGVMYAELGETEKGEGAFQRALDLSSKMEDGWKNLGVFYIKIGRFDQAVSLLGQAQKKFPDSKEIQRYLEVSVKATQGR